MADDAYMYCPMCRNMGTPNARLMRDNVDLFCMMGHRAPHAQMLAMQPEMIKPTVMFKPGPGDVKVEVWCNQEVYQKAKESLGERFHPTLASLIRCCMMGEPIIIDGKQAEELHKLKIRTGQEMVAMAKQNVELVGQNENLSEQVIRWETRIASALAHTD